jgi:hypothetical protein
MDVMKHWAKMLRILPFFSGFVQKPAFLNNSIDKILKMEIIKSLSQNPVNFGRRLWKKRSEARFFLLNPGARNNLCIQMP